VLVELRVLQVLKAQQVLKVLLVMMAHRVPQDLEHKVLPAHKAHLVLTEPKEPMD
jgi:hypothetical protein